MEQEQPCKKGNAWIGDFARRVDERIREFKASELDPFSERLEQLIQRADQFLETRAKGIPKLIMQTWKTHTVPEHWSASPQSYADVMKSWDYQLLNDKENDQIVKTFFPEFYPTYKSLIHPIMRADSIRYCWMYLMGGFYSDLDYQLQKPLDELFQEMDAPLYFVQSGNIHMVTNSILASKPRQKFWLEMLAHIIYQNNIQNHPWWFISKHWVVMGTTGPMALQKVLDGHRGPYGMLPTREITPCTLCELEFEKDEVRVCGGMDEPELKKTYMKQLKGSSWHSDDSSMINKVFCQPRDMVLAGLLILVLAGLMIGLVWKGRSGKAALLLALILIFVGMILIFPKVFD